MNLLLLPYWLYVLPFDVECEVPAMNFLDAIFANVNMLLCCVDGCEHGRIGQKGAEGTTTCS